MSTPVRRLPRSNTPQPGQSLAGYILNLAYRLDVTPSLLMTHTGLTAKSRVHVLQLGFGMVLPSEPLAAFSHATGLTEKEVTSLTMASLADLTVLPRMSKVRNDGQWVDIATTRYCPDCLTDHDPELPQPVWQLRWRTPWAIACTRHQRTLLSTCPTCETSVGQTSGLLRSLIPHVMVPVAHPAACRAKTSHAKHLPMCGTRLDQATAPPADQETLRLQQRLDHILGRGDTTGLTSLGVPVNGRQYLLDLRLVMILIQMANEPAVFDRTTEPFATAARCYVTERASTVGQLTRQSRTLTLPPSEHHANAGLLLAAADLLAKPETRTSINLLATRAASTEKHNWRTAQAVSEPSEALWAALTSTRQHTTAPAKLHTHIAGAQFTFRPENVPAYLPKDLFTKHFPELGSDYERRIRRHVPIALARLVGDFATAKEAGLFLGYTNHAIQQATGRVAAAFPSEGANELQSRVANIARELEAAPRIDYHYPRTLIDHQWLLSDHDWQHLRHQLTYAGLGRSNVNWDKRRYLYAIWLWSILTAGDINLAPLVVHTPRVLGQRDGLAKYLRDLQRKSSPHHHDLIEVTAARLRTTL